MTIIPLVNAHTHRSPSVGEFAVVNLHKDSVEVPGAGYYSAGIHPWFIQEERLEEHFRWLQKMLEAPGIVALGECGLDRLAKTPWKLQTVVFERQLELAERFSKPVIIHNVRSGSELLQLKKSLAPDQRWLLHGYHGSVREAELFLMHGCSFGFGKHLLNPKSKAVEACSVLPLDKILPETDDANITIREIYNLLSEIRGVTADDVAKALYSNFTGFFEIDPSISDITE